MLEEIWKTLQPHIAGALGALIPAAVALAVAWMKARKAELEAEHQAALGAVLAVEAQSQMQRMGSVEKKLRATDMASGALGRPVRPERVQQAWAEMQERRLSTPPSADTDPQRVHNRT